MAENEGTEGKGEGEGTEGSGTGTGTGSEGSGESKKSSEPDWKNEAEKWKSLSRKNEAAAKRLQAIEDANKTELQKAQERAEAADKKVAEVEKRAMRAEVGAEKKLPKSIAARLQGDTLEEMMADADAIIKDLGLEDKEKKSSGSDGGRNKENLTSLLESSAAANGKMPDMNEFMRAQRGKKD